MLELLTGSGLAMAAGLNAYIPLLALGLLSRFTDVLTLPAGWGWLEGDIALVVLAVLLAVEVVADKIPVLDSINDVLQTVVRPASGGLVLAAGSASQTPAVTDPATLEGWGWVPVVLGVLLALATHTVKSIARPAVNLTTAGAGAPVVSTAEDVSAVGLVVVSLLLPVVVAALVAALVALLVLAVRRRLTGRRERPPGRRPAGPGGGLAG
ncbi:DUF4126 domain-containing protein [Georgenia yuyongxinii]|uniref:DUF4126 domain-containing protein n=1 Tax=Georgenia yuyongxinii TaxID=2589797 RepID=A0A5B8C1Y6_9MICO|nr:DUF4126 domain-containing protein [Georgenia yuyongxinii]QDC24613.1 DUF4126 domain-containing protein [Georgenia yuyongxinii]